MYLSRIALNTKRRETLHALTSLQFIHSAIENSFDGERKRNLWRIDWYKNKCYLLVLSVEKGDFSNIVNQFGYTDSEWQWETKKYDPLLSQLEKDQIWKFRLCANPVRSSFKERNKRTDRGRIFAHVTPEQQKQWLIGKSESCGFKLEEDGFDVINTRWIKFYKGKYNHQVILRAATFEGLLTITDVERFKQSLISGIGRAKAYGCGLLTIARPRGESL
ncbi:MAG: type I-E CRISPR-associated protein Cas6/Cse3/CasE [Clostridiales bacterium]|nr:type I-E CRISPR-associated protein Cas6/Cse3/CasE [Clostridiales bacterium]